MGHGSVLTEQRVAALDRCGDPSAGWGAYVVSTRLTHDGGGKFMATDKADRAMYDELEDLVLVLANKAAEQGTSSYAVNYAAAANHLAVAAAWLRSPSNSHGVAASTGS